MNGLVLWLRADRGVNQPTPGQVGEWQDQSGQGHHATQSTVSARPRLSNTGIGSRPSVVFDGVDDFLRLPSAFDDFRLGVSVFATIQHAQADYCAGVVELANGSEIDDIHLGQFDGRMLYEVYDRVQQAGTIPFGTPQLLAAVHHTNLNFEMRQNGRMTGGGMNMTLPVRVIRQQNFVGRSQYGSCVLFPGMMSEILIYNRAVTGAEVTTIETALRDRSNCCRQ